MLCSVSAVKTTTKVKAVESPVESTAETAAAEPKESARRSVLPACHNRWLITWTERAVSRGLRRISSAVRVMRNLLGRMLIVWDGLRSLELQQHGRLCPARVCAAQRGSMRVLGTFSYLLFLSPTREAGFPGDLASPLSGKGRRACFTALLGSQFR